MATKKLKSKALAVQAPQSRDEVVEHIRIIGDLTRQRTRLAATMNDGIAELQEQYAQQADPINERIEALQAGVQVWCEANRATCRLMAPVAIGTSGRRCSSTGFPKAAIGAPSRTLA